MSLKAAFKFIIDKQGRPVTLDRNGTTYSVVMAPSNYGRNLSLPEEIVSEGLEFVVSKDSLDAESVPLPLRRGDTIVDADMGANTITEVKEMFALGELIGYRVRTS